MYNGTIIINNIEAAKEFVDKMTPFMDIKIDLISGDYCIDGHSIIGIISLDFTKPITITAQGDITDEFLNTLKQFDI